MAPDQTRRRKQALAARAPSAIDPADRLSQLPEETQAQILSFLPAQEAVRTCVLARTWRHVWKLTRRLLLTDRDFVLLQEVRGFVDRLLRLRLDGLKDHGPIDACKMVFYWGRHDDDDDDEDDVAMDISRAIKSWIRRVLECQVQSLRVDISRDDGSYIPMSNKPLVSQRLTRLELKGLDFLGRRGCLDFSGCPALEHLEVKDCELSDLTKMASPSVKHLVMADCASLRFHLCFPLLLSLCLENFFDYTPVLESMPQLREAYVYADEIYSTTSVDYEASGQDIIKCVLLEGLAQAKHLVLTSADDTLVFRWDLRFCPTFSKLKTLVLDDYWCQSADCSELACLLEHTPVLEKLTVFFSELCFRRVRGLKYDVVIKGRPDTTGKSTMISQHLKIVKVKCSEVHQSVLKVLKFLGTLSICFDEYNESRVTEGSK